jgi:uncharacterized protein (TIGR02001 family)
MTNQLLPTLLALVSVAGLTNLRAQAPAAASAVTFSATTTVVSQYMFRGQRLNGAGFQPSVEMAAGDFTAGLWGNFVLDEKVADSSDPELDLFGAYTFTLNEAASLVPGFTSYHYPSAPKNAGLYRWTFEPNLALNYTFEGVRFTPKIYYDTVLKGATYELSAAYALPLQSLGSELDFTATAGTFKLKDAADATSPAVKSWGDYWLLGVAMPFQVNATTKITLGYAYTEGRNAYTKQGALGRSPNSLAIGRGVVTVSAAFSF